MENIFSAFKEKRFTKEGVLDTESEEIVKYLNETKNKIEYAELCLNYTNDELLIDSLIYEITSLQKKFEYYLKLSKQKEISISTPNVLRRFPAS